MRSFAGVLAGSLWFGSMGCQPLNEEMYAVEGSTWLAEAPVPVEKGSVTVDIFPDRAACKAASNEVDQVAVDGCIPQVSRSVCKTNDGETDCHRGEVEFSFRLMDRELGGATYLSLDQSQISLAHAGQEVAPDRWELEQHGAERGSQLFIVLIDGSSSIYETGGIEKVRKALNNQKVMDAFLPKKRDGRAAGVMLLRFSEDVKTLDGQDPLKAGSIIERQDTYKAMVRDNLISNDQGYSHVYGAINYTVSKLISNGAVKEWIELNRAEPTIVLLTDGFNNEAANDTCATNVERLTSTLQTIQRVRAGAAKKFRIYTIGLGRAMQPQFKLPPGGAVSEVELCRSYAKDTIDGDLERRGIDNPSLMWLSEWGGGESFVKNNHKGLSDVFLKAASQNYKWYTVRYEIDSYYMRRSFDSKVRLLAYAQGESSIRFLPSPWLDAPPSEIPPGERWTAPVPFSKSISLTLIVLGLLSLMALFGPAMFNIRRALFRRPRS